MINLLDIPPIEYLGYAAMIVILVSVSVNSLKLFRIYNIIGCIMFIFYGLYHGTTPVVCLNILVVLINFYQLYKNKES